MSPGRRSGRPNRSRGRQKSHRQQQPPAQKAATRDFWGHTLTDEPPVDPVHRSSDPTSVVRSLGDPPLRNHSASAHHYFAAVYQRAAVMAGALAAANNLLAADDD